jgi:hypothetical protein
MIDTEPHETMIRIKPQVWEMIQFEKKLGESNSKVIERVFQERFDVYEKIMEELEKEETKNEVA